MNRRTRCIAGLLGISTSVIVAGVLTGGIPLAQGADTPPTTAGPGSISGGPTPVAAATASSTALVESALPAGFSVTGSRTVATAGADYEEVTGIAVNGSTYVVTVYHKFSSSELTGAALPQSSFAGGTVWIGSDSPDMRSIYFLGSNGAGVRIANSSSAGHAASISLLESEVARMAALAPKAELG